MSIIETENITLEYRFGETKQTVLNNISFKIFKKDFIAICGPSGSGKSSLLYLLGGLLAPTKGSIKIHNQDLSKLNSHNLAVMRNQTIGFVFQQFHLLPKANVIDNILLPATYRENLDKKSARDRAVMLAKKMGLENHLSHMPNQLSGGQQQRVAIARALMNDPELILADEPTGNLDSKTAREIIDLFAELNRSENRTIVIITHDKDIAEKCNDIWHIKDGDLETNNKTQHEDEKSATVHFDDKPARISPVAACVQALENLSRNKIRSFLTMLGIVIGIASVLSMITLGDFTKTKILETYEALGVNKLTFSGWPNWRMKATDITSSKFQEFSVDQDLVPLQRLFPEVIRLSPLMRSWDTTVSYGGETITDIQPQGVGYDYFAITDWKLLLGKTFTPYHIESRHSVCVIGFDVADRLLRSQNPIGKTIYLTKDKMSFACRVLGVLEKKRSNNTWDKPNQQVLLPYTFLKGVIANYWNKRIERFVMTIDRNADIQQTGEKIDAYFKMKYGNSGHFNIGTDDVLVSQVKKFLSIFSLFLAAVAIVSLFVGGIGITNMMLVSVNERIKEIGIRKAVGASNENIRTQFLSESVVLCALAGIIGVALGIIVYQGVIWAAASFWDNLEFEWIINPLAIIFSVVCIILVGLLSGIVPAFKAQKLQVVEALRNE